MQILSLSPGKIDNYKHLTDEETLPSDKSRMIEQAKFTYIPLGKASEKQTEIFEDRGRKQDGALKVLEPDV